MAARRGPVNARCGCRGPDTLSSFLAVNWCRRYRDALSLCLLLLPSSGFLSFNGMVAKRKIAFNQQDKTSASEFGPAMQTKTVRRNARERNRVKQIDVGFEKLRTTIPTAANQKKISRVKILASAVDYIQHLHTMINEHEAVCRSGVGTIIKQEPVSSLPTPPKCSAASPQMMSHQYSAFSAPYPGMQPQYPMSPYTPHSPISPYHPGMTMAGQPQYPGSHSDSGYYSSHSPVSAVTPRSQTSHLRRGPYRDNRDSLSPSSVSTYSDSSVHSSNPYLTPGSMVSPDHHQPSLTQDPTPSSTFREEDELLDSIVQWEKY